MNARAFLAAAGAACVLNLPATPDLAEITVERYPDADSVVVSSVCDIVYEPDGTSRERDETLTKVLTEKGRRSERVQQLSFCRRYGEARFVAVSVIGTNGVERTVDIAKTLKETTDNSSVSANIYDPQDRRLVCSVPELAVGETLRTVTERTCTAARVKDQWADIELFESTDPVLKAEVRITAPAARPLRKTAVRNPLGNLTYRTEPAADGATLHVWCATNSPQAFPEPDMPPLYTQLQNLYVSTSGSWEELSRWYWELCVPHLAQTNAAMGAKVRELVAPFGDAPCRAVSATNEALRAIFRFVSQEIRYMGLTLEDTSPGYAPHDVSLTFDNRYGVCRDKAALLVALLRIAGFDAYPVLINAGAKMDDEVPTPFFNHAIVAVKESEPRGDEPPTCSSTSQSRNSETPKLRNHETSKLRNPETSKLRNSETPKPSTYLLMDPTDESARDLMPAYLGDCSYLVAHPDGEPLRRSPVTPPERNRLTVGVEGTLSRDGSVFADVEVAFNGMNDTLFRHALVRKTPDERRKLFERLVGRAFTGAELLRFDVRPADLNETGTDLAVTMAVRLPDLLLRGETRDALTVPFLSPVLGLANWLFEGRTSLEHRRFPFELQSTASIEERVRVKLGEELGPAVFLPTDAPIAGKYAFGRTFAVTNGVLEATRSLAVSALTFSTNEYVALREDLKRVEARERPCPLFAPNELAEADWRNRLVRTEVDCRGPDCWTVTNTTVREILTYDGKKRQAEMKFGFHPDWKSVEVVSAVVSNRDGSVTHLTPKEMNVLDCGWAAAAPRYPAGKTLVVTLPRVEIGSTISTVVATTVTNAPASFYGLYAFDTFVPTDRLEVRVNGWRRDVVRPRRLVSEPLMPDASFGRDIEIVSSNDFARAAVVLSRAAAVEPCDPSLAAGQESGPPGRVTLLRDRSNGRLLSLRDWMAKNIRVAGPSLYEVPIDRQLTAPATVLAERYATRLDYIRTLCALLKGDGYDADIVFAADDAGDDPRLVRRDQVEKPNVRAYATALCRVRERTGGFLFWGGEERVTFLGLENEYAPLGASAHARAHYFDPTAGTFGTVTVPEADLETRVRDAMRITLRENGAADFDLTRELWGAGVGPFRKRYAEMLPEIRDRHHQQLLGEIADAASATGELVTDVAGYPARRTFSCYVPDYAVVRDGAMTVTLAPFMDGVINMSGRVRRNPIGLPSGSDCETEVEVVFPEGYVNAEHLPEAFRVHHPLDASETWSELSVETAVRENRLVVRLVSRERFHAECVAPHDYFPLFRDWAHAGLARANRTIVVRRGRTDPARYRRVAFEIQECSKRPQ